MRRAILAVLFTIAAAGMSVAVEPDEILADPALEGRARALSAGLRCLVCQNQSIDDSAAPLARDLRILIRERLMAGDSDRQIIDFVVARYGEFVLLKPPFNARTIVLWLIPLGLLACGGVYLWTRRRSPASASEGPMTQDESERLARLLNSPPPCGEG